MNIALAGLVILIISIVGGILFAKRASAKQHGQNKFVLFVLFFWVLAFFQLILFGFGYALIK